MSQRRACCVLQADRSSVRYNSKRIDDAEQREAIKRISKERRRFGYRRIKAVCVLFESNWGSQAHLSLIHFCLEVDHGQTLLFGSSGTDLRLRR